MPFIVPTFYLMLKMQHMQMKPTYLRVNYLKNLYYTRILSYPTIFIISNMFLLK